MASIHHATLARAAQNGVILEETKVFPNGQTQYTFVARPANGAVDLEADSVVGVPGDLAKHVLDDYLARRMIDAEYQGLAYRRSENVWVVATSDGEEFFDTETGRLRDAMTLALEYCSENEIDPSEPQDEDETASDDTESPEDGGEATEGGEGSSEEEEAAEDDRPGSVVPVKYRTEYKARGNPDNCCDWLAETLDGRFHTRATVGSPSRFDWHAFRDVLVENGVDMTGKWASLPTSGQNHWVGRYRMNGRQKLEKIVASKGFLVLFGRKVMAPEEALISLWNRHPDAETSYEENRKA